MTKEELEKEAEDKGIKYADSLKYTISKFSDEEGYCWSKVEEAYEKGALDFAEPRENRISEIEKENTKLKTDYKVLSCSVGDFGELQDKLQEEQRKNNGLFDNLIKAKEIISKYYKYNPSCEYSYEDIDKEAEQFLKGWRG